MNTSRERAKMKLDGVLQPSIVDDIIDAAVEATLAVLPQHRPEQPNELRIRTTRVLFEFSSLDDWTRNAQRRYRMQFDPPASQLCMLAVDSRGRVCASGRHFREAEEDHTYPVKVYEVATI